MSTRTNLRLGGLFALALFALALLASILPAGGAQAATATGSARLRAVHAVPNFGPVDVYVNGAAVLSGVPFFTVSDYLTLDPGSYLVQVIPAGDKLAKPRAFIINKRYTLAANADYSLVARGLAGTNKLGPTLLKDTNAAPAAGKASLRVAHVAADLHEVDVYVNGEKAISALSFRGTSPYLSVPAGTYTVGVAKAGEQPFFTGSLTVAAGQVVTAWANGQRLPTADGKPFTVTPTVDASFAQGQARVRAVHAIPDIAGSPVDVYIDDAKVVTFDFFKVTGYLPIAAGPHTVRVVLAGGNPATEAVITADVTLAADTDYSLIARGTGGNFGATALIDDNSRPAIGQARVRAAHFSPDAPAVDVYVNGTKTISGLSFKSASDYLSVPAGTYTLGIAPAGGAVIFSADATLKAGQVVTVWANGLLAGSGAKAFTLTPSVDAEFAQGQARVRAVHAIPDIAGSPVDVYIDDAKVVTFDFFKVTGYLPIAAGPHTVRVVLAGGNPATEAVISADVTLAADTDYSLIARGTGGDFAATALIDDNSRPAIGQARVRAAHFSPDAPAVDVYVNGSKTISGLSFKSASDYLSVPAGTYTLGIAPAGGAVIFSADATLKAGQVVTVWANGLLAGSGAKAFTLTPSIDASFPQARVRLLHAVPDAPPVDIFLDGERVAAGLSFGTISGYLPVFAGTYSVEIRPAGGSAVVFSGSVTVEGDSSYTAAAIGLLAGSPPISVALFKEIPADLGDDEARIRVINLSPDAPMVDVLAGKDRVSSGLGYQGGSSTVLGAGAKVLRVVPKSGGADLMSSRQVLAGGSDTTLFVVGLAGRSASAATQLRMVAARNVAGAPQQVSVIYLPQVVR